MIAATRPFLPPLEDYQREVQRIWASGRLTNQGPLARQLELQVQDYLQSPPCLFVSSGTMALQLAIRGLQLKGEVITTPFSYVASASSLVWEQCRPVFVDVDPEFLTIDERKIEEAITPHTSAILATHIYGNPCAVDAIEALAQTHGLRVIYDGAHAFGVRYRGRSLLSYGDISVTSFNATKLFHTGEGGGLFCGDEDRLQQCRQLHNFGRDEQENIVGIGINGKNSELHAALGLAIFPYLQQILDRRMAQCALYIKLLAPLGLGLIRIRPGADWNGAFFPVFFSSETQLLAALQHLQSHDIWPRRYFFPNLAELPVLGAANCPVSAEVSRRVLCLPLSHELTAEQQHWIVELIAEKI